jgi:poly(3-hydroxybutyrate) depolymerase
MPRFQTLLALIALLGCAEQGGDGQGARAGSGGTAGSGGQAGASGTPAAGGGSGGTELDARGMAGTGGGGGATGSAAPDARADVSMSPADSAVAPGDSARDGSRDAVSGGGPSQSRQTARPVGTTAARNGFWEYLPPGYGDGARRPLLVFWHGLSGNGNGTLTDLPRVAAYGPPGLIARNQWPANRPFVVLSPQHGPTDCPPPEEIRDFLTFSLASYDIDLTRVYLTGLSCGAMGSAVYLGQLKGQQVVAAVLIAGDASPAFRAAGCSLVGEVALWSFHGDRDSVVNIAGDNEGMNGFLACPRPSAATRPPWPGAVSVSSLRSDAIQFLGTRCQFAASGTIDLGTGDPGCEANDPCKKCLGGVGGGFSKRSTAL